MTAAPTSRRVLLTPVLNEEASGLPVLQVAAALLHAGIVDEMVAADGGCTDGTTELVRRAGHRVIPPGAVSTLGKGGNVVHALRSLDLRADDCVLLLDADVHLAEPLAVGRLLDALVDGVALVKADFGRLDPSGRHRRLRGGRVTELAARPLLAQVDPALAALGQPLSGQIAARFGDLIAVDHLSHYALEIGMLLAMRARGTIREAFIGDLRNTQRDDLHLSRVAQDVVDGFFLATGSASRPGSRVQVLGVTP